MGVAARGACIMRVTPTSNLSQRDRGVVVILVSIVLLSSGSTIVKSADTSGTVVAAWRLLLATLAWWVVLAVRHRWKATPYPSRATWRAVIPAGVFFGLDLVLFFTALNSTSVAHAEFIGSLTPLLLVPIGIVAFGERPRPVALPFGLVTLVGLAAFMFTGASDGSASLRGDVIAVGALAAWVCYLSFGRRARATVGVSEFMTVVMTIGLVIAAPISLVTAGDQLWPLSGRTWFLVALLTVVTGMVGHALIAVAQRLLDVGTISVIQVLNPLAAVTWAWVVLGERVAAVQIPGMVLIVGGLVGFVAVNRQRRAPIEFPPAAEVDPVVVDAAARTFGGAAELAAEADAG